ncbi:vitamin D3 receptor-like isoform X2 [Littorina saxatilis]|uniref:Nuclear hormone receptor HR96 n=1 Tax=Littorina saxatilis TaxID=31220 RepID=A0AAN9GKV9_9CAEN
MADSSHIKESEVVPLHEDSEELSPATLHLVNMAGSSDDTENFVFSEEGDDSMRKRPKSKMKHSKTCGVCGDRALGYNFNAVTCESCKAFFRRNAFKDTQIKCLFKGNCVIDLRTRRFCPACRIKKCFEIGMKRDMILDDGERKARMAKVLHNRAKKGQNPITTTGIKEEPIDHDEFRVESSNISSPSCSESVQSPSATSSTANCSDKLFQQILQDRFPTDPGMYRQLTEPDRLLLNDIAVCYETTVAALPDMDFCQPENYQNANDLVNNSEMCVRQLIKFVKRLDDFRSLCQEDQIAALKSAIMKSLLLRSVAFYIMEKDAWLTQKGEIPTSILREATGFNFLHDLHVGYCRTLKSIILNNFTLYALLQVLMIFHPDGNNLLDRELMSNLQDKYINLLKHYLESEYSFEFAQEYFVAILGKMSELKTLSDHHSRILLQVNPNQIEPLMLEVLNLK